MYNNVTLSVTIPVELLSDLIEISKLTGNPINDLLYYSVKSFTKQSLFPDQLEAAREMAKHIPDFIKNHRPINNLNTPIKEEAPNENS